MKSDYPTTVFSDAVIINPKRTLRKGDIATAVSMADIKEFTKKIQNFTLKEYKGGSRFRNGDTLFARITPCLENGKTAFVDILEDAEIGFGSTEFIVFSEKPGISDANYIYYLSRSDLVRNHAIKSMSGTSGRQRVDRSIFDNFQVPLPSLLTQKKIAHILKNLDDKIETNHLLNSKLEKLGETLFKRWFVDYEFPDENGKPYRSNDGKMKESPHGQIPKEWELGQIGDISNNKRNLFKPDPKNDSIPYFGLEHLPRKSIALSNWGSSENVTSNKYRFVKNDILFGKLRPYFHKVGVAPLNGICSTDILVLEPKRPEYFGYLLSRVSSIDFINYTNASSTGTRMPRTNWKTMSEYIVTIPSNHILQKWNEIMTKAVDVHHNNIFQTQKLKRLRDLLLPRLISGKIRVPLEEI